MGLLYYGSPPDPIRIEDRALAHLQVVIVTKLRRDESFTVSWQEPDEADGRSTIWLHPAIPLRFAFDDSEPPQLNRAWLSEMADRAAESGGIFLSEESHPVTATIERPV